MFSQTIMYGFSFETQPPCVHDKTTVNQIISSVQNKEQYKKAIKDILVNKIYNTAFS